VPENYVTFLKNQLTETFGLQGIPVRIGFRKAENPFDKKKK
jgi:predicted GTPase